MVGYTTSFIMLLRSLIYTIISFNAGIVLKCGIVTVMDIHDQISVTKSTLSGEIIDRIIVM